MKTAIMTWFHYHNYGTALQVMALNKKATQVSGESFVINYKPYGNTVRFNDKTNILKRGYAHILKKIKRKLGYIDDGKIYSCEEREKKFLDI